MSVRVDLAGRGRAEDRRGVRLGGAGRQEEQSEPALCGDRDGTDVSLQAYPAASELDYRSLAGAAAGLARRLRDAGAGPEVSIGVCARRAPDLPVAVLGVLMTGAACVPLDTADPWHRMVSILDDAEISALVVDPTGRELLASGRRLAAIRGGVAANGRERGALEPDPIAIHPGAAAFLRYVSGPDGRPAGVVPSHHGRLPWARRTAAVSRRLSVPAAESSRPHHG